MTENMLADLGYTALRTHAALFVGDTIYAESEVLETDGLSGREDTGVLRYRITARRPDADVVLTVERRALVKLRCHWQTRDERFAKRAHADAVTLLTNTSQETSVRGSLAGKGRP
jgi:hypothetical protein